MRKIFTALLTVLAVWPAAVLAAPKVPELVEQAISALHTRSYHGTLRLLTKPSGSEESVLQIQHVAPDLFRVTPVENGQPIKSYCYIENAAELVKLYGRIIQPLPERQYAVTDALTAKFLRDLGQHKGTELLDGNYKGVPLYILRKDITPERPYLITVGLRQDNAFPMFLQVVDGQGRTRVHNQFEQISFVKSSELADALFVVPEPSAAKGSSRTPRAQQSENYALPAPAGKAARSAEASPADSGASVAASIADDLPLYPGWLPPGYRLEAISALDFAAGQTPSIVYQLEIYGPHLDDLISVFQTQCDALGDCNLGQALGPASGGGYLLQKQGKWVVAAFGDLPRPDLQRVLDYLRAADSERVMRLIDATRERDRMLAEATAGR